MQKNQHTQAGREFLISSSVDHVFPQLSGSIDVYLGEPALALLRKPIVETILSKL